MKISQGFGILIYFNFILSDLFINKYTVGAHMLSYWVTNRKPVGSNIGHTHKTCGLQHWFICCRCFFFSCSLFTNLNNLPIYFMMFFFYLLWFTNLNYFLENMSLHNDWMLGADPIQIHHHLHRLFSKGDKVHGHPVHLQRL